MKYPRGTVLRWTVKAHQRLGDKIDANDRLVVLNHDTMVLYKGNEVLATSLYKTIDSFVELAHESVPVGMIYNVSKSQAPASVQEETDLAKEFGFRIIRTKMKPNYHMFSTEGNVAIETMMQHIEAGIQGFVFGYVSESMKQIAGKYPEVYDTMVRETIAGAVKQRFNVTLDPYSMELK